MIQQLTGPTWRRNPLLRLFSSIKLGVTLMLIILAYASILSALPQVRGAIETSEMQAFAHWLFSAMIVLLCINLIVATLTRIRFTLINAGVLTVHAGILLLCGGGLYYFGTKVEGDVLLLSPRVEIVNGDRVLAKFLPEVGQRWSQFMPAFGGNVAVEITAASPRESAGPREVEITGNLGDTPPQVIRLNSASTVAQFGDRLTLRLVEFPAETQFFDRERAALYARPETAGQWKSAELVGLPMFRERYTDRGYKLDDMNNHVVESKRTWPHINIAGVSIPTGWFEPWRLPIRVDLPDAPFEIEINGFVPYLENTRIVPREDPAAPGPAVDLRISEPRAGRMLLERTLFAADPTRAVLPISPPLEFRQLADDAELSALLATKTGPAELKIKVLEPPAELTLPVEPGKEIAIEGTPYKLRVTQVFPSWPLMSPGFENEVSPAALVEVTSDAKKFTRTAIERFPQLSQDIDEAGVRRRDALYDPNIEILYRSASGDRAYILTTPALAAKKEALFAAPAADGSMASTPLPVGRAANVTLAGMSVDLTLTRFLERTRVAHVPVIEPMETRRPNVSLRSMSAIRLSIKGRGPAEGWQTEEWCLFSSYPHIDDRPIRVQPPGGPAWEICYSRLAHDFGYGLRPGKLAVKFFPGRQAVDSWRSEFLVDKPGQPTYLGEVSTNRTHTVGDWTFFQSGAATDHWSYTILGVGNRNGIWPMLLGCVMITLGCLYAFYIKPILRRRATQAALAAASVRSMAAEKVALVGAGRAEQLGIGGR